MSFKNIIENVVHILFVLGMIYCIAAWLFTRHSVLNAFEKEVDRSQGHLDEQMLHNFKIRPSYRYNLKNGYSYSAVNAEEISNDASSPIINEHLPYESIPSFEEWKAVIFAKQGLGGQQISLPSLYNMITGEKNKYNYASVRCGAKIISSNPESKKSEHILNDMNDKYMLSECKANIWFIIELCYPVQLSQIEIGNFELFSSSLKDFSVYWSNQYQEKKWHLLGSFRAEDHRDMQTFSIHTEEFVKFLKVEVLSHYGKEHYCILSAIRIFGTNMLEKVNSLL